MARGRNWKRKGISLQLPLRSQRFRINPLKGQQVGLVATQRGPLLSTAIPALSCELKDADRTLAWLHFRSEEDARGFEMSSYEQGKRNFSSASFEDKPMFEDS